MTYLLIRHKVKDFKKWKVAYDDHKPARDKAGLSEGQVLKNVDDPTEVILLFIAANLRKAKAFAASADLKKAMANAGVTGKPQVTFLTG